MASDGLAGSPSMAWMWEDVPFEPVEPTVYSLL
jgi:hypothetical protein